MTATGHALIGTVIAAKIGNPALAAPIALASHFVADAVPHWDTATDREKKSRTKFFLETFIDVILGFILSWFLIQWFFPATNFGYACLIIVISELPDWITAPYLFLNWKFAPFTWIYKLQKKINIELDLPWGLINQVVAVMALILLVKFF